MKRLAEFANKAVKDSYGNVRGVGTDLIQVSRLTQMLARNPKYRTKLARRILFGDEIVRASKLKPEQHDLFLARCWATKEALFKALDNERQTGFQMVEWGTVDLVHRKPVILGPHVKANEEFLVTVTHDGDFVLAIVLRLPR
ncbi:4'-phosphopantetheinyl transferase superfamily [Lipomyces japonicus]|uniref:4'-phosphopantetheinyl transferase superfamily n=1 Tax=Lipomyces japonicus TaxID=56871 RepID=UPI0034CE679C